MKATHADVSSCRVSPMIASKMQFLHSIYNVFRGFQQSPLTNVSVHLFQTAQQEHTNVLELLSASNCQYNFTICPPSHCEMQKCYDLKAIESSLDLNFAKTITRLTHGWCCCGPGRCEEYISTNEKASTKAGIKELWGSYTAPSLFISTYP